MRRAVFLDRDGVINALCYDLEHGLVDSPLNPDQFHLLPGVGEAISILERLGFLRVLVSNQPIIAKGKSTRALLDAITARMHTDLAMAGATLDATYYCLHHPQATLEDYRIECDCRKPRPGLLLRAGQELGIDMTRSFMIGDGLTDIQAGRQAGCTTIWIGSRRCDTCRIAEREEAVPDLVAAHLLEAAQIIHTLEGESNGDLSRYVQPHRD
jgi:D-glycero-D-manno-heptose 1,7-bisphosphate phosphatase